MSDQTIFNNDDSAPTIVADVVPATTNNTAQETVSDPYLSLLDGITTTEGRKKYATVSDALNSIPHKESHISTLEAELAAARLELDTRATVADSVSAATQAPVPTEKPDEQTLEQLVNQVLKGRDDESLRNANKQKVVSSLIEIYGDKAEEVYVSKAKELGVSPSVLDDLSLTSPSLVLTHFSKEVKPTPTQSSYRPSLTTATGNSPPITERKKVMLGGASTSDVVSAWRQCKPE